MVIGLYSWHLQRPFLAARAHSSGGERFLDTEEVRGSNPRAPTETFPQVESRFSNSWGCPETSLSAEGIRQESVSERSGLDSESWTARRCRASRASAAASSTPS